MFARYLLSACQCILKTLKKAKSIFIMLMIRNNYFDLKNTCFCKSKRLHEFGEYYCEKHEQILIFKFFIHFTPLEMNSFHACKTCVHSDGLCYNSCFNYYKFLYLPDTIKICISSIHLRNKGRYRRYRNFNINEARGFF